tara:strand:- start:11501 stop:12001 length:501 start_codon:yes stop_codon:yes gene_type:complete
MDQDPQASGGASNWRKPGYTDKLMEVQSAITGAAASGNPEGLFYAVEIFVSMLRPHWDLTDKELKLVANKRIREVVKEFRDMRAIVEKNWDDPTMAMERPPPSRLFKMNGLCWKLFDEVIQPLVKKTKVSKSKMYDDSSIGVKKDKDGNIVIDPEESRSTDDGGDL